MQKDIPKYALCPRAFVQAQRQEVALQILRKNGTQPTRSIAMSQKGETEALQREERRKLKEAKKAHSKTTKTKTKTKKRNKKRKGTKNENSNRAEAGDSENETSSLLCNQFLIFFCFEIGLKLHFLNLQLLLYPSMWSLVFCANLASLPWLVWWVSVHIFLSNLQMREPPTHIWPQNNYMF